MIPQINWKDVARGLSWVALGLLGILAVVFFIYGLDCLLNFLWPRTWLR